eukprot:2376851-Rhodomonas_salina.3
MRGTAEYLNGISAWRGMDDEIDDARHQLKQAVAHSAQDREELDRLRKMLQQEREAAQRREQEIEQMQSANADELVKLNETLRRAEQVLTHRLCMQNNHVAIRVTDALVSRRGGSQSSSCTRCSNERQTWPRS